MGRANIFGFENRMIRCTLLTEGPSDISLIPIIEWLFNLVRPAEIVDVEWADLARLAPGKSLDAQVPVALENYPSDLMLIHRDSDRDGLVSRVSQIAETIAQLRAPPAFVSIVPVRMTESWLLINESAIRIAAGNPNGKMHLPMPRIRELEGLIDPKSTLNLLLKTASGKSGRELKKFKSHRCWRNVAVNISDFSPLLQLDSFSSFRDRLTSAIQRF